MSLFKKVDLPSHIGRNEPVDSCILFVHGLAGNKATWSKFAHHLSKQWIYDDSFGLEYDVYTMESNIPIWSFIKRWLFAGPSIDILANSIQTFVNEVCKEYKNVIIVAHSMGGLVARQYLVNLVKQNMTVGKIKCLITYATPHKGSEIATLYKRLGLHNLDIPLYYLSQQIVQMCSEESEFIEKLNKDWSDFKIENKIDFRRVVGERDFIVSSNSASLGIPLYDSIANKTHFDIIKPSSAKDPAFMITFNYLKHFKQQIEREQEIVELNELAMEDEN